MQSTLHWRAQHALILGTSEQCRAYECSKLSGKSLSCHGRQLVCVLTAGVLSSVLLHLQLQYNLC